MALPIKRLRVFAGPNGSGKSTLVYQLSKERAGEHNGLFHLHRFINADEIAADLRTTGGLPWDAFQTTLTWKEMREQIIAGGRVPPDHPFLRKAALEKGRLIGPTNFVDDYLPAAIADALRVDALNHDESFSFETVMSHVSKVEFMEQARSRGYRVYLYFSSGVCAYCPAHSKR